jgi:hypothetical protein
MQERFIKLTLLIIVLLFLVPIYGNSSSNDFDCQKCKRSVESCRETLNKMGKSAVATISMAATCSSMEETCGRLCSTPGSSEPSARLGDSSYQLAGESLLEEQLDGTLEDLEETVRQQVLKNKISAIVNRHRMLAKASCIDRFGLVSDACVQVKLTDLLMTERSIRKIMSDIGAKPDDYFTVQMLLFNSIQKGY